MLNVYPYLYVIQLLKWCDSLNTLTNAHTFLTHIQTGMSNFRFECSVGLVPFWVIKTWRIWGTFSEIKHASFGAGEMVQFLLHTLWAPVTKYLDYSDCWGLYTSWIEGLGLKKSVTKSQRHLHRMEPSTIDDIEIQEWGLTYLYTILLT